MAQAMGEAHSLSHLLSYITALPRQTIRKKLQGRTSINTDA